MSYSVRIKGSAGKELARLPRDARERMVDAIDSLSETPLAGRALKGQLLGLRRLRVVNFRIVYEVRENELVVLVVRVAHRREAYR